MNILFFYLCGVLVNNDCRIKTYIITVPVYAAPYTIRSRFETNVQFLHGLSLLSELPSVRYLNCGPFLFTIQN